MLRTRHALSLLGLLWLCCTVSVRSQIQCATNQTNSTRTLTNNDPEDINFSTCNFSSSQTYCFRLYIHVVRNDGGITITNNMAAEQVEILNAAFNPHGISFVWDGSIDSYIDNVPISVGIFNINNHEGGIDLYLSNTVHFSLANGIGESSELLIQANHIGTPIVPHEMGHVFGLFHTHHGQDFGGENDGDSMACIELPNYSYGNACNCGDYVADTPGDDGSILGNDPGDSCYHIGDEYPPNSGNNYIPDVTNFMSYSTFNCMDNFTEGQANRIKYFLEVQPLPHLIYAQCPTPTPCAQCNSQQLIDTVIASVSETQTCGTIKATRPFLGCGQDEEIYIDWDEGDGPVLMVPGVNEHIYSENGDFAITVSVMVGEEYCNSGQVSARIDCPTLFNDEFSLVAGVTPNPSSGEYTIESTRPLSRLEVYSISGQLLLSEPFNRQLNIQKFDPGIYFLKVYDKARRSSAVKLIKQ